MANPVISMPLKSVAKDKHQLADPANTAVEAEVWRARGRDLQPCQALSQPTQRALFGRPACPHSLHLVGLR